jgi:hypothetical protein
VQRHGRELEEDEIQRHRIGHPNLDIGVAVAVGASGDGGRRPGPGPDQPLVDRGDDLGILPHGVERGHPRARGGGVLHVRIGEEQFAELADADDERDQHRRDQRELDRADASFLTAKVAFQHHWVLSAPEACKWMVS